MPPRAGGVVEDTVARGPDTAAQRVEAAVGVTRLTIERLAEGVLTDSDVLAKVRNLVLPRRAWLAHAHRVASGVDREVLNVDVKHVASGAAGGGLFLLAKKRVSDRRHEAWHRSAEALLKPRRAVVVRADLVGVLRERLHDVKVGDLLLDHDGVGPLMVHVATHLNGQHVAGTVGGQHDVATANMPVVWVPLRGEPAGRDGGPLEGLADGLVGKGGQPPGVDEVV